MMQEGHIQMMTLLRFITISFLLILPTASYADWINLSGAENARNIAEIYIEKDSVRIQLEVYVAVKITLGAMESGHNVFWPAHTLPDDQHHRQRPIWHYLGYTTDHTNPVCLVPSYFPNHSSNR